MWLFLECAGFGLAVVAALAVVTLVLGWLFGPSIDAAISSSIDTGTGDGEPETWCDHPGCNLARRVHVARIIESLEAQKAGWTPADDEQVAALLRDAS